MFGGAGGVRLSGAVVNLVRSAHHRLHSFLTSDESLNVDVRWLILVLSVHSTSSSETCDALRLWNVFDDS